MNVNFCSVVSSDLFSDVFSSLFTSHQFLFSESIILFHIADIKEVFEDDLL